MALNEMIYSAVKILGGLLLVVGSITTGVENPKWSRISLFLAGALIFASGILTAIKLGYSSALSSRVDYLVGHYSLALASIGAGILLTLLLSGELSFRKLGKK